jgi:hypothetical protein
MTDLDGDCKTSPRGAGAIDLYRATRRCAASPLPFFCSAALKPIFHIAGCAPRQRKIRRHPPLTADCIPVDRGGQRTSAAIPRSADCLILSTNQPKVGIDAGRRFRFIPRAYLPVPMRPMSPRVCRTYLGARPLLETLLKAGGLGVQIAPVHRVPWIHLGLHCRSRSKMDERCTSERAENEHQIAHLFHLVWCINGMSSGSNAGRVRSG